MSEKCELLFEPVDLESLDRIRPYTSAYGEDSCQHSPVSMFALQDKYGDSCCILDGFLYVLRSRLCDEKYRVYLAPLGEGDRTAAYARILDDARQIGYRAILLDTLPALESAVRMYRGLGFYEIPCYNDSPVEKTYFFRLDL